MYVVTKPSLAASTAARYRAAYQARGHWLPALNGVSTADRYARLAALPQDASEPQILSATGDDRWTTNVCDECGREAEITVAFAAEIHHPTDTVYICLDCLQQAVTLARSAQPLAAVPS